MRLPLAWRALAVGFVVDKGVWTTLRIWHLRKASSFGSEKDTGRRPEPKEGFLRRGSSPRARTRKTYGLPKAGLAERGTDTPINDSVPRRTGECQSKIAKRPTMAKAQKAKEPIRKIISMLSSIRSRFHFVKNVSVGDSGA